METFVLIFTSVDVGDFVQQATLTIMLIEKVSTSNIADSFATTKKNEIN